jgi:hypothetical protein
MMRKKLKRNGERVTGDGTTRVVVVVGCPVTSPTKFWCCLFLLDRDDGGGVVHILSISVHAIMPYTIFLNIA